MRIAFMGASGTGKSTLAQWLVGPDAGLEITRGLPICPVGSRSTAKAMGFVGPDGEGRPYDVDRADLGVYEYCRNFRNSPEAWPYSGPAPTTPEDAARWALQPWHMLSAHKTGTSCRPMFQRRLAEDKIAWETNGPWSEIRGYKDGQRVYKSGGFITDRTPLDDVAYAIMHCREVVDEAFLARAIEHMQTYDLIIFCPRDVFQQTAGDAARLSDPVYHILYEVVLGGLVSRAENLEGSMNILTLNKADMEERKGAIRAALAREERRIRQAQLREEE